MRVKIVILLSFVMQLSACGGGSDDTAPAAKPIPAAKLTLELQYQANKCDITSPISGADIILHRQDGSMLSQSKSTADGKVNIDWPVEAKHFSIAVDVDGETQVDTYTEAVASDFGILQYTKASLDNSCSCETFSFDTSEVKAVYSGFTPLINNNESLKKNYCKNNGRYAPVNIVLMPNQSGVSAYAAELDLNDKDASQTILISSSIFDGSNNLGVLLTTHVQPLQPFDTRFTTYSETEYGRINWLTWQNEPQIFSNLYSNNFISSHFGENMGGNQYGDLYYFSSARKRVTNSTVDQVLALPQNQLQFLEQTNVILSSMVSDGPTSYDFSTIGTGKVLLSVRLFESGVADWSVEAPLSGSMPELSLPSSIEEKFEKMTNPKMTVMIYGYNAHLPNQFNEHRQQRAKRSREQSGVRSSQVDNYVYEIIDITLLR
jgi:hypothetical protein